MIQIDPVRSTAPIQYRGYVVEPSTYPFECNKFTYRHEDYDGPEDDRIGYAATLQECFVEIDIQREDFCEDCEDPLDDDAVCQSCAAANFYEAGDQAFEARREQNWENE